MLELRNSTKNETSLVVITEIKSRSYLDYCLSTCDEKVKKYFFKISICNLESFDWPKNAKNIFRFFQNWIFKFFSLENSNEQKYDFVENRCWLVSSLIQSELSFWWPFSCRQNSVNRGTLDVTIRLMKLNWWQGLLRQRFGDSCFIIWVTTNNVFV